MLFNSLHFIIFFPVVAFIFFSLKKVKSRQIILLIASWYFYAAWKPEYIILLLVSTGVDYFASLKIASSEDERKRRTFLLLSIIINFGILFGFKYFYFFDKNIHRLLVHYNLISNIQEKRTLLLPVGISFYTFQTVSYTIDVFKRRIKPEKNFVKFALFVSFFPQLVAGPIERAGHLLPQFEKFTKPDYKRISHGLKLMFWGFFQKIVIADTLSLIVDEVYKNSGNYYGADIWLATFFFAFQIYCDFSGYTDIARGAAKILGYNLRINFKRPYFSKSFSEFWHRWHISLSTWFRDYVYIPLGGSKTKSKARFIFNIMFVFVLSGFWHGAGWTFIIWGALHGIYYLSEKFIIPKMFDKKGLINGLLRITLVFVAVNFAWIFFRSQSVRIASALITDSFLFSKSSFNFNHFLLAKSFFFTGIVFTVSLIEQKKDIVSYISEKPLALRWSVYYLAGLIMIFLGNYGIEEFIYFRF
ncbi:MAG: MBOAT family protein [Chlorobi bacterium]|nr:MBOAT family protein [Chlorobiota bacterium]